MENYHIDITGTKVETERLLLRPFKESDLDDFNEYAKVPGVGEAAGWPHHQSKEESLSIIHLFIKERHTYAIVLKNNGKVIGSLGLECPSFDLSGYEKSQAKEIGYVLSKEQWGKGYMSEAVKGIISFLFKNYPLDCLTVCHFKGNERSKGVILNNGFHYVLTKTCLTRMGILVKENLCYLLNRAK